MPPLNGPPLMSFCEVRVRLSNTFSFLFRPNGMSKASQFDVTRIAAINYFSREIFRHRHTHTAQSLKTFDESLLTSLL